MNNIIRTYNSIFNQNLD